MEHVDEQLLALMALGESVPGHDHVQSCDQCRQEVDELTAVVAAVRGGDANAQPVDDLVDPPSSVWAAIHGELGLAADLATDPLADVTGARGSTAPRGAMLSDDDVSRSGTPVRALRSVPTAAEASTESTARGEAPAQPTMLRPRRPRMLWAVAGAAAAGLVVGGVGVALTKSTTPADTPPPVVAEVGLDPLEGWTAEGSARVVQAADGAHELVVDMPTKVEDAGYREVWLIDKDVQRLVSLGVMSGTEATFAIPEGLDLAEFPVVDISLEQFDGDPSHSGDSILRGILPT